MDQAQVDRESELLTWVTSKCQDETSIGLDEGWKKLEEYGIQVLEGMLESAAGAASGGADDHVGSAVAAAGTGVAAAATAMGLGGTAGGGGKRGMRGVFTTKGFASLYTLSYKMCNQPANMDWSSELYTRHKASIRTYIERVVVPALRQQASAKAYLLREFIAHWENHKIMTQWMYGFQQQVASLRDAAPTSAL